MLDVQRNMLELPEPVPAAQEVSGVIGDLLGRARTAGAVVVHIRNNGTEDDPDVPDTPGWELVHEVREGEHVIDKFEPNAFTATGLSKLLPLATDVVVVGMQSEYCVRETSLAALARGHSVTLVRGAHATYDDGLTASATAQQVEEELAGLGVGVVDHHEVVFRAPH
jgi:nicotinamidase-related amidase